MKLFNTFSRLMNVQSFDRVSKKIEQVTFPGTTWTSRSVTPIASIYTSVEAEKPTVYR